MSYRTQAFFFVKILLMKGINRKYRESVWIGLFKRTQLCLLCCDANFLFTLALLCALLQVMLFLNSLRRPFPMRPNRWNLQTSSPQCPGLIHSCLRISVPTLICGTSAGSYYSSHMDKLKSSGASPSTKKWRRATCLRRQLLFKGSSVIK